MEKKTLMSRDDAGGSTAPNLKDLPARPKGLLRRERDASDTADTARGGTEAVAPTRARYWDRLAGECVFRRGGLSTRVRQGVSRAPCSAGISAIGRSLAWVQARKAATSWA